MQKPLTSRLGARIAAILLLIVGEAAAIAASVGIITAASAGIYTSANYFESDACESAAVSEASQFYYLYAAYGTEAVQTELSRYTFPAERNYSVRLLDPVTGAVLAESAPLEDAAGRVIRYDFEKAVVEISVSGAPTAPDSLRDGWRQDRFLRPLRYVMIAVCAAGVLLAVGSLLFLFGAAGHRGPQGEIQLTMVDRVPLDLLFLIDAGLAYGCSAFFLSLTSMEWISTVLAGCVCEALLLAFLLSFSARVKAGGCLKNTLIWKLLRLIGRGLRALPLIWQAAALILCVFLGEFLLLALMQDGGAGALLFTAANLALLGFLFFGVLQMRRLQKAGEALAAGNFDYHLDTAHMYAALRQHGENLNAIGGGLAAAVEQRMKSERLKTELITNVSHDIKTPLTSIVNYADLLQRPGLTDEERQDYLEVLSRQSRRLKKLTEDLVEASKAATGNLSVALVPTNVRELLEQAVAEYQDRLTAGNLEPVLRADDETAMADGRLLWRVLDNLLCNVCKYALAGTRVYLDARREGARVVVTVRNVSREPLALSVEELTERFVRGDSSRATEGSGLGLSIAKSLTELQRGVFTLSVDGDLFKAEVSLERAAPEPES